MQPKAFFELLTGVLATPILSAGTALWWHTRRTSGRERSLRDVEEHRGLRVLIVQTLLPSMQAVGLSYRGRLPQIVGVLWFFLLPLLDVALAVISVTLLARSGRGAGRLLLPLLSLGTLTLGAVLVLFSLGAP